MARRRVATTPAAPGSLRRSVAIAPRSQCRRLRSLAVKNRGRPRRPGDRQKGDRSRPSVLASGTGPRTTASATVVASVMSPECSITAASAVGPSNHGTENTMWSFTETARKPSSRGCLGVLDEMFERERVTAEVHQRQMSPEIHPHVPFRDAERDGRYALGQVGASRPLALECSEDCSKEVVRRCALIRPVVVPERARNDEVQTWDDPELLSAVPEGADPPLPWHDVVCPTQVPVVAVPPAVVDLNALRASRHRVARLPHELANLGDRGVHLVGLAGDLVG